MDGLGEEKEQVAWQASWDGSFKGLAELNTTMEY